MQIVADLVWGWGAQAPLPQELIELKRRVRRRGKKGEKRKKKGARGRRREIRPTPDTNNGIRVWIQMMPWNYVVPEGLVVNKPIAFYCCYTCFCTSIF